MGRTKQSLAVGFVCKFPPENCGIATTYVDLARALKNRIRLVTIGTEKSDADYAVDFDAWGLKEQIEKIIRKEKLDLVHFQYIAPYYGRNIANLNFLRALHVSVPLVVTLHEVQFPHQPGNLLAQVKKTVLRFIERKIVEKAQTIIVHTAQQARYLNEKYHTKKAVNILYGLTPKSEVERSGNHLLFFGIFSKYKGIDLLIDAMRSLPEFKLTIAGATNSRDLDVYARDLQSHAGANIHWIIKPWITLEEREQIYKQADAIILPYRWAPYQSAVVTDAGSYGLPVVVSDTGSLADVIKQFGCGVVIAPNKVSSIIQGIKKLFKSRARYRQGMQKYRKAANWDTVTNEHLKVYSEVHP